MKKLDLEWLHKNEEYIIYSCVYGSHAYGTAIETSDRDIRGVYIMPQSELYGLEYTPQIHDETNDEVYYEIGRFCELLLLSNTSVLEMLHIRTDCVIKKHSAFDSLFISLKDEFISKDLIKSMVRMCQSQISKASGLNKKMNMDKAKMTRKSVLDFCYVPHYQGSICVLEWLETNGYKQENCGLVKVPNMRDGYSLFHSLEYNYKGISKKDNATDVLLSSIPKGENPLTFMQFNKDSYTVHCKEYKEYLDWLNNRNTQRYVDVEGHSQKIDGKNMMHCIRIIETIEELINTGIYNVRRNNREYLLSIRKGQLTLEDIKTKALEVLSTLEEKINRINTIKDINDPERINTLLVELRKRFYYYNQ